jgi:hypothetical protein
VSDLTLEQIDEMEESLIGIGNAKELLSLAREAIRLREVLNGSCATCVKGETTEDCRVNRCAAWTPREGLWELKN